MIVLRRLYQVAASVGAVIAGLATASPSQAAVTEFVFNGNCTDCAFKAEANSFPVTAILLLSDYTEGTDLGAGSYFVSFRYSGSNLLDPYLVSINGEPDGGPVPPYTHQFATMTGNLSIGGAQSLSLRFGDGLEFDLATNGNWFTCGAKDDVGYYAVPCSWQNNADMGTGAFVGPPIPEPGTCALLALGLVGLAGLGARGRAAATR